MERRHRALGLDARKLDDLAYFISPRPHLSDEKGRLKPPFRRLDSLTGQLLLFSGIVFRINIVNSPTGRSVELERPPYKSEHLSFPKFHPVLGWRVGAESAHHAIRC
jgi:hypothetical protein